jgi:hypothetical protein
MSDSSSESHDDALPEGLTTAFVSRDFTSENIALYRAYFQRAQEYKAELVEVEKYTYLENGGGTYLCMRPIRGREISTCSKKGGR